MTEGAGGPRPRLAELGRDVAAAINGLVVVAKAAGRAELGERLVEASQRWPDPTATVVVIGERGVGRSTVVNALVGQLDPPLLPAGGALAVVRTGAPAAKLVHVADHEPYEAADGTPIPEDATVELVVPTIITGNELVLVEAPGTSSRRDPKRPVVEALVDTADAVILVKRADSPLTAPELELLATARRRTGAALVVVTHVDRFRGWRTILQDDRRLLEETEATMIDAPPIPFAAPLAADAEVAAAKGEPVGDALAEESGLDALRSTVRATIVERIRLIRLLSLVQLSAAVAEELDETLRERRTVEPEDPLATAQAESRRIRESGAAWLVALADGCGFLRDSLAVEVGREVATAMEEFEAALVEARDLDAATVAVQQSLEAARLRIDARSEREMQQLVARISAEVAGQGLGDDPDADPEDPNPVTEDPDAPRHRSKGGSITASMRLRLAQALVSGTGGIALLAAMGSAGGTADLVRGGAMGIGMLVGSIGAAEGFREARRQRLTSDNRTRVRSVVEQWRAEYLATLRERLLRAQREHEAALRAAVKAEVEAAEAQVAELQRLARADAGERKRAQQEAETAASTLAEVRARLADLAVVLRP